METFCCVSVVEWSVEACTAIWGSSSYSRDILLLFSPGSGFQHTQLQYQGEVVCHMFCWRHPVLHTRECNFYVLRSCCFKFSKCCSLSNESGGTSATVCWQFLPYNETNKKKTTWKICFVLDSFESQQVQIIYWKFTEIFYQQIYKILLMSAYFKQLILNTLTHQFKTYSNFLYFFCSN